MDVVFEKYKINKYGMFFSKCMFLFYVYCYEFILIILRMEEIELFLLEKFDFSC